MTFRAHNYKHIALNIKTEIKIIKLTVNSLNRYKGKSAGK